MGALATLPVFYKLTNKKALVAGGSDAAAWKAELLAAAGAEVHVYAVELGQGFARLLAARPGAYCWHQRPWAADSFADKQIALCDAETEDEGQRFYRAARAAGVAVNVIDRPAFCQFQFGAIVNRSPAVIGISTDGGAPILGQAIRRRIETVIAPSLATWAQVAQDIRARVSERLAPGPQRRAFWEKFVDRAFGPAAKAAAAEDLLLESARIAAASQSGQDKDKGKGVSVGAGKVTLVGAGPGAAELLTLKAVRALQAADVILFDDLIGDDVLELARREAARLRVKPSSGGTGGAPQDGGQMMLCLAKAGKNVVRLTRGDPTIFGRAGEEIARLNDAGIAVSIVPGITAASAMAAQLGASPAHRDPAQPGGRQRFAAAGTTTPHNQTVRGAVHGAAMTHDKSSGWRSDRFFPPVAERAAR